MRLRSQKEFRTNWREWRKLYWIWIERFSKTINMWVDIEFFIYHDSNKVKNLQHRLNEAEMTIKSFHEKWKYQQQSIETAKGEIRRLEKQVSELNAVKLKLTNELEQEIKKSKLLEEQLNNNKIPWMQVTKRKKKQGNSSILTSFYCLLLLLLYLLRLKIYNSYLLSWLVLSPL